MSARRAKVFGSASFNSARLNGTEELTRKYASVISAKNSIGLVGV
jgi:hypothetical protein